MKKSYLISTYFILFILALSYWFISSWTPRVTTSNSTILNKIVDYDNRKNNEGRLDFTPVLHEFIKPGMTKSEAEIYLSSSGFDTYTSLSDSETMIANFYTKIGPSLFNVYRTYRIKLYFTENIVTAFEGTAFNESP